ncbi:putative G-protein coupled receptor 19 [Oculina patagonica]
MDVLTLLISGISIQLLVFTIFGNFLVIVVINKNKKLQNVNTCLIFSLAWSDFGFAIVTFFEIFLVSNNVSYSSFQFVMNALSSIYFLVALAVERYFGILKPFLHMKRVGKSLTWKVIFAVWLFAGVFSAARFVIESLSSQSTWERKNATTNETSSSPHENVTNDALFWFKTLSTVSTVYIFVLFTFGLVIPSVVMIFCYSRVIYHMWFNTDNNKATNLALFKSRRKLTKLFIILTITFLFTWTPTFGRPVVTRFGNEENARKYQLFSMFFALVGSAANPVIYSFRCPRFRQELFKLLNCRCCKRKRRLNANRIFVANSHSLKETKRTPATVQPVSISVGAAGQPLTLL